MKLLLDEMFAADIADELNARGHDDYRPLHVAAVAPGGPGHHGMVFMAGNYRRTRGDMGRIIKSLEHKLAEFPGDDDLGNAETWL